MSLFRAGEAPAFRAALPPYGRLLGLDVGTKTIGIAVSDPGRMIASPHSTFVRQKFSKDAAALMALYVQLGGAGWVVGLPLSMDGRHSPQTQRVQQFAEELQRLHPVPLLLWDERLSTAAVERLLTEQADISRHRRSMLVDKLAASYILQGVLDGFM